jgi:hypothetical protein
MKISTGWNVEDRFLPLIRLWHLFVDVSPLRTVVWRSSVYGFDGTKYNNSIIQASGCAFYNLRTGDGI